MMALHRLSLFLSLPAGYRVFGQLIGVGALRQTYLTEYVKPAVGEKVLDIGCGPADVLQFLPSVDYLGIDISSKYINSAKRRFQKEGRFLCSDVGLTTIERESGTFDLAMATGLLHHLDDERAAKLFDLARCALRPNGRLITFDGCFVPGQSRIARWMLEHDRGKFVRSREEYVRLAGSSFPKIDHVLRDDLLRIPYTHLIMCCSN
jgi:SAM-dependent methyltransferase